MAIMAVLATLAFPAIWRAQERAGDAKCISILRQLGVGVQLYAADNNNYIVPGHSPSWHHSLARTMGITPEWSLREDKEWRCPRAAEVGDKSPWRNSYAINRFLADAAFDTSGKPSVRFSNLPSGRRFVLIGDQPLVNNEYIEYMGIMQNTAQEHHYFRHNGKMNVLWTDFSISAIDKTELLKDCANTEKSLWRFQ